MEQKRKWYLIIFLVTSCANAIEITATSNHGSFGMNSMISDNSEMHGNIMIGENFITEVKADVEKGSISAWGEHLSTDVIGTNYLFMWNGFNGNSFVEVKNL